MFNPDNKTGTKQLKNRIKRQQSDGRKTVSELERQLKELNDSVAKRFGSSGHAMSRVYARTAQAATEIGHIKARLDAIGKLDLSGYVNEDQLNQALKAHNDRIDIHSANYDKVIQELRNEFDDRLTGIDGRLNGHETRISMLQDGQTSMHNRQTKLEKQFKSVDRRVSVIDGGAKFPLVRLLIAVVVGVIAGLLWDAGTFRSVLQVPYSSEGIPLTYTFAESPWAAVFFGVAVGALVLGIAMLFPAQPKKTKQETTETTTMTTNRDTHGTASQADPDQPATPATAIQPAVARNGGR